MNEKQRFGGENGVAPGDVRHGAVDIISAGGLREGNRIEAKLARGGLPGSLWETYSAFANSEGGDILLGVEELPGHVLRAVGIGDAAKLLKQFWDTVNNRAKVSLNILSDRNVTVETMEGKEIIRIRVPRAERSDRPVFLNRDMLGATYRRNGEGDYRCSRDEVRAMLRDSESKSVDLKIVEEMECGAFNLETVHRYRNRMQACRPGHVWLDLDDETFLARLGALGRDAQGSLRPTRAGLLMFGNEYDIVREFHDYFLDYQERMDPGTRWSDRITSSSGEWSGNLYDFYFRVYNRLSQTIPVPFRMSGQDRVDDTPIHKSIREALVNCLVNADFDLPRGVVVVREYGMLTLCNPGCFRVPIATAKSGGVSDPRNATILKMFSLIDIGERSGHGIPMIDACWRARNWPESVLEEAYAPERTTVRLTMPMSERVAIKSSDKKVAIKSDDKKVAIKGVEVILSAKGLEHWRKIAEYFAMHEYARSSELAEVIGVKPARIRAFLGELCRKGLLIAEGVNKSRRYRRQRG